MDNFYIRRGVDLLPLPAPLDNETRLTRYRECLERKIHIQDATGFTVDLADLHPEVRKEGFKHQGAIVRWALRGGRRLIAASFGLGKTTMSAETVRQIHRLTGGRTLIICPLGVKPQFIYKDGPRLGMTFQYVRNDADIEATDCPYLITNYERVREGHISPKHFVAVVLDEGSVLADWGSKTFQLFTRLFKDTPYRFVATATPARNKYKELLHYAHFLGIADSGQALTRYFKRNSKRAQDLTLMESMEREFWLWVASWGLFIEKPSDLGAEFSDDGYIMPKLNIHWVRIPTDHKRAWKEMDGWGQRYLFANAAAGVTQAAREKRHSMPDRIQKAVEIVQSKGPDTHWILWHHLEDERKLIKRLLPEAVEIYGSQSIDEKERRILAFSDGEFRILATKPKITGSGCNFQHYCHSMIFCGVQYKFEEFIQAIHRLLRYGQLYDVDVYVIYTDAEDEIVNALKRKWRQHDQLVANTTAIIRKYGLTVEAMKTELRRTMDVNRREVAGQFFRAVNNDCVEEIANVPDNSVDLIMTSVPFGDQYEYTESYRDFGHNPGNVRFWEQMDYLIPELKRVLKPGRLAVIHVKDRILYGNVTGLGAPTVDPFSDDCSYSFRKHGFHLMTRRTVVNDVVQENNRTYRLGYSEMLKDSTKMGSGTPEYLMVFRNPQTDTSRGYADEPVSKPRPDVRFRCSHCKHELESLDGLDAVMMQEWEDGSEDPVEYHICPACAQPARFYSFQIGDYLLHHWQGDASEYWRSSGDRLLKPEDLVGMDLDQIYRWYADYTRRNVYNHEEHRELGRELAKVNRLPKTFMLFAPAVPAAYQDSVWSVHDYNRMQTLNNKQSARRQENHLCPLPIDLVKRCITLYSNPGEIVLDPFAGVFTVPYVAIETGRIGWGFELSEEYFDAGVYYCQQIEQKRRMPTLFDLMGWEGHTNGREEIRS